MGAPDLPFHALGGHFDDDGEAAGEFRADPSRVLGQDDPGLA